MRRVLLLLLIPLSFTSLTAQDTLTAGDKVRVSTIQERGVVGYWVSLDDNQLTLRSEARDSSLVLPLASLTKLEVSRGQKSRADKGARIGLGTGVAAGVVQDDSDLYADAQLNDQGFFKEFVHADAGTHRYPGLMWKAAGTPNEMRTPPVRLGEYNEFVYRELMGVSPEEYARLEETGHIGTVYASHLP